MFTGQQLLNAISSIHHQNNSGGQEMSRYSIGATMNSGKKSLTHLPKICQAWSHYSILQVPFWRATGFHKGSISHLTEHLKNNSPLDG